MRILVAIGLGMLSAGGCRRGDGHAYTNCAANMRSIAVAFALHATEHAGVAGADETPAVVESLETLVKAGHLELGRMTCPSARPNQAGYTYLPEVATALQRDPYAVLLYEQPNNHGGAGVNVMFADMHCDWMTVEAFEKALAETQKRLESP